MRTLFAKELLKYAKKNKNIVVVSFDLGYKMWDDFSKLPGQFYNVGSSEQAGIGIAVGLALSGKKVFCYSITNFLIYRPFEFIRFYINKEKIPIKLVASGRDRDYLDLGFSHWSEDDREVLKIFSNIKAFWPDNVEEIPLLVKEMITDNNPWYINLKR